jgi:hypothetical protein
MSHSLKPEKVTRFARVVTGGGTITASEQKSIKKILIISIS